MTLESWQGWERDSGANFEVGEEETEIEIFHLPRFGFKRKTSRCLGSNLQEPGDDFPLVFFSIEIGEEEIVTLYRFRFKRKISNRFGLQFPRS